MLCANTQGDRNVSLLTSLPQVITAVGGLGTAAFGLVDATKVFWGGVNHVGFSRIEARITSLMPAAGQALNALPLADALNTLKGNWFNGTDLSSQKAIAKSLIKLHLDPDNAAALAKATNIDPVQLTTVAGKMATGVALLPEESDVYARFDLIVTALLDETYQMADQAYVNGARALAMVFAILLAIAGAGVLDNGFKGQHILEAIIIGLLATPLAPIAKDLASALSTAVNTLQIAK
jgi:hypothetical protein